jgi:uncharacterized protein (TIGR02145 family)
MVEQLVSSKRRFEAMLVKVCAVAGLAAIAVSAQTDIARGKTATTSSTEAAYGAANAVDGNNATRWGSQFSNPQWIMVDLGTKCFISSVKLVWEAASAKDYKIQVSATGSDPWKDIATQTNMPYVAPSRTDNLTALSDSGRYIRMYGTARTTNYGFSLFSFEVYSNLRTNFTLTTSVNPAGAGTVSPAGGSYASGATATVTPAANSGYQFSNWSGDMGGSANPGTIVMIGDKSVTANFTPVSGFQAGDMSYYNGSIWTRIPKGNPGQVLTENATQVPTWTNPTVVADIDGNLYTTVTIGTQTWMQQDLKATRYNDGAPIPNVTDAAAWAGLTTPGYCWYDNNAVYKTTYGALYNWYAINTGKLAPKGWHVPTNAEWTTLSTYLGGDGVSGGKLKEAGLDHWLTPNTGATNETGFSALANGFRSTVGFNARIEQCGWWSATESGSSTAYDCRLVYIGSQMVRDWGYVKGCGFSVRLIKD